MNIDLYQKKALSTAVYPNIEKVLTESYDIFLPDSRLKDNKLGLIYLSLGLTGETIELFEKINNYKFFHNDQEDIIKEIGDCIWYVSNICCELNIKLSQIYADKSSTCEKYLNEKITCNQLIIISGKVSELIKKQIRDKNLDFNEQAFIDKFKDLLITYSSIVDNLINLMGLNIQYITKINIEKLFSRKKRNKISGNGDNR